MKQFHKLCCFLFFVLLCFPLPVAAQTSDEVLEAKVISLQTVEKEFVGSLLPVMVVEVQVLKGPMQDMILTIDQPPSQKDNFFATGDSVLVSASRVEGQDPVYYIVDVVRTDAIFILALMFSILAIVIAGWQGVRSLIGLFASFFVLMSVVMPRLFSGAEPVTTAILGALIITPLTFYMTHGITRKTTIAFVGTTCALLLTAMLAKWFIVASKLTGYAAEEVQFLQIAKGGTLNPQGLLLAGIIIGTLGILDDVTISQASIVEELRKVNAKLKNFQLFAHAMRVGRDHIAATINTLVLVYTGASLPLLLLFLNSSQPFSTLVNYEIVAEEITRSLLGSIGLMLAVPLTTAIAVYWSSKKSSSVS